MREEKDQIPEGFEPTTSGVADICPTAVPKPLAKVRPNINATNLSTNALL